MLLAGALAFALAIPQARKSAGSAAQPDPRRSIVFYLVDTCRADRLSAYGAKRKTSPFLEELAKKGVQFQNCFSQAPSTKPSMSAILTSCYPTVTGMHRFFDQLDPAFVTLPEALAAAGWHTAGFSTNPVMGRMSGYDQGFAEFTEAMQIIPGGDAIGHSTGSAEALNKKVVPWLQKTKEWPYFLYVHSIDPHEEYAPDEKYLRKFTNETAEREFKKQRRELREKNPDKIGSVCTQEHFERAKVKVAPYVDTAMALYDADLCANDDQIEVLNNALKKERKLEELILVVTSDHGEEFMEHGGTSHAYTLWNELLHVPLIMVAPGLIPEGVTIKEPVQSVDLYPTLLDLLGIEKPETLQGTSFADLLCGDVGDVGRRGHPVFAEIHEMPGGEKFFPEQGHMLSVIEGPWKYILNVKSSLNRPRPRHELYRLDKDFAEKENLAAREPALVEKFEEMVLEWWARNQ